MSTAILLLGKHLMHKTIGMGRCGGDNRGFVAGFIHSEDCHDKQRTGTGISVQFIRKLHDSEPMRIDEGILLKWVLKKYFMSVWTRYMQLRIGSRRVLVNGVMNPRVP
jgi:hypothetical protein